VVFGRNPKVTLLRAALWAVVCLVIFRFVLLPIQVSGISMLPTYRDHSINLVNEFAYLWHEPRRGDVVAIRFIQTDKAISRMEPPDIVLLKRIIGLPGESVAFAKGRVLINGKILDESYENENYPCDWNCAPVTLGPNQYYIVGDNRSMPPEDHTHGKCERNQIVGKALL
jgi:signal peptidase I